MKELALGTWLICLLVAACGPALSDTDYSAPLRDEYPRNLYWGDLHVHSNRSPDAFAFGNTALTPADAYRFAQGYEVKASNGMQVQLRRPLDFLLVADHAEFLGVFPKLINRDSAFLSTGLGKRWRQILDEKGDLTPVITEWVKLIQDPDYQQELSVEFRRSIWQESVALAERYNQPGRFTALIGYEWTAMVDGNNLHRVVVYRDGGDKAALLPPFSSLDSQDPEELWQALSRYEDTTGGRVLAIPHNGNVSNGLMFALSTVAGEAITGQYARTRSRWEPLYEVTQVKGDSETHPFLSPDDDFADYETWDEDNIGRTVKKQNAMLAFEYARSALKLGLQAGAQFGANPFEFGLIGSTDSHTALATADENNFFGKFLDSEPSKTRAFNRMGGTLWLNWKLAASGYVGVWADGNTRQSLFDALQRKEVYATTGPRISLRFFGGWSFSPEDRYASDIVSVGYGRGQAMGGRLTGADEEASPTFLIAAYKDPDGANLDRVQIIKGWLDGAGQLHEKLYDVALSDGREVDAKTGKAPAIQSTVNVAEASYTNEFGMASAVTFWRDPDFDRAESAFYYVRVIEVPTPRWSAYDAKFFGLESSTLDGIPMVTQERVYSSPIWYYPDR